MVLFHILSILVFSIGITGLWLQRSNMIGLLICLEVTILAPIILFVGASVHHQNLIGQVWGLVILTCTAAHTVVALALIVLFYRSHKTIAVDFEAKLKG